MDLIFDNYTISSDDKITVITGNNGSGKTRAIEKIRNQVGESNKYIVLDCDSHNYLNINELKNFADDLKEKSKTKQIIIASLRNEIICIADKVITLKGRL